MKKSNAKSTPDKIIEIDKLIAIPKTSIFGTRINEEMQSTIKENKETILFTFIFPTAESRFPYKFLESIFIAKLNSKILKIVPFWLYLFPKNRFKIFSLK